MYRSTAAGACRVAAAASVNAVIRGGSTQGCLERSVQSLDEGVGEVDEGRHLMERFYDRYSKTTQVDLVFVLDRSGSVPHKGWRSIIQFVKVHQVHCQVK